MWDEDPEINAEIEADIDEAIEKLRGTLDTIDCLECGVKNAMHYEGDICFICSKCGMSWHEDLVYAYFAGYDIKEIEKGNQRLW